MSVLDEQLEQAYETCGQDRELLSAVDRVLEDHHVDEARAAFERAGARDFLGLEADAIPLYREALERGLREPERIQCMIQLGSSLRNVGDAALAVVVLRDARDEAQADERDWVDAFLALALHSNGETAQALSVALRALAPHLSRYGRPVSAYAAELGAPLV